ncbi:hydroxymyristoyl-ACP dehydratase [Treponema sp.]|uniref:ApeI family dehydratase n=1 Tax=Treponema sp. TaxID=166 RepID=UPI00388E3BAD
MIHGIPAEEILEKTDNSISLKVKIDASSDYFDGHFPEFKLLPAVAQIDLLVHYAQKYFGLPLSTPSIKRFKFSDKILPDANVLFKIDFDSEKGRVSFEVSDFADGRVYSSGIYSI